MKDIYSFEWQQKLDSSIACSNSGNDDLKIDCRDHLGLWKNELCDWVPEKIFDAHIHLGRKDFMTKPFSSSRLATALSSFAHMTIEELDAIYAELFKSKDIVGMFAFPFPQPEVDGSRANCYIIELMQNDSRVKGFLRSDPIDTAADIRTFSAAESKGARFYGVKPYFDLLGKSNYDTQLKEILPDKLLSFMNSERLILMLHTTGRGMGDPTVLEYLSRIVDKFPDIKIILAHMGRYLDVRDFECFMNSDLRKSQNIFFDISFASEKTVYDLALSDPGLRKRLMFASDNPFGLILGGEFFKRDGKAELMTRNKYTWSENGSWGYNMTWNSYHCLKAFKDALESAEENVDKRQSVKEDIFLNNALSMLHS